MMGIYFLFSSLLITVAPGDMSVQTAEAPPPKLLSSNVEDLDANLLRRRLEKIHGESGRRMNSSWEVAVGGQILKWDFDGEWKCVDSPVSCADWRSLGLLWFETKNSWLKPWVQMKKGSIVLDAERRAPLSNPAMVDPSLPSTEVTPVAVDENADPIQLGGQRLALQSWTWIDQEGKDLQVYTSLRNSWVERIDHEGIQEYIEWRRHPKTRLLQINQLILEKQGLRLTARRLEPVSKPKP